MSAFLTELVELHRERRMTVDAIAEVLKRDPRVICRRLLKEGFTPRQPPRERPPRGRAALHAEIIKRIIELRREGLSCIAIGDEVCRHESVVRKVLAVHAPEMCGKLGQRRKQTTTVRRKCLCCLREFTPASRYLFMCPPCRMAA